MIQSALKRIGFDNGNILYKKWDHFYQMAALWGHNPLDDAHSHDFYVSIEK